MSYASGSRRAVGFSTSADWTTADERSFSGSYSHPPSYDEFSYYQEQEYDESRYSEYGYGQTNGFGRQDAAPTVYNELIRASSSDSLEYQYGPPYDVRNTGNMPLQSPYGNQQVKCRQLPCRTFISCGSCPYGDRCVFLHDAAVVSKPIYIRSKRKSKDDTTVDAFFWPTMPWTAVMGRVDMRNMPLIAQPYIVPAPNSYSLSTSNNDVAVYSMWEHFLDFCKEDPLSVVTVPRKVPLLNPYAQTNIYTGKRRLPVFVKLSQYSNGCGYFPAESGLGLRARGGLGGLGGVGEDATHGPTVFGLGNANGLPDVALF